MCAQILLFALICTFASSENQLEREKQQSHQVTPKNLMKVFEKIDSINERLDELEANSSAENNVLYNDKNKIIITNEELIHKIEKIEEHLKKIDKIEELLLQLVERNEQKINDSADGILNEVTPQCTLTCESKMTEWTNGTSSQFKVNLEKLNFCIKDDQKVSNSCDPNPCLNGGRCKALSTGLDRYRCLDCPYPTSGKICENVSCGMNTCFQHNNTAYIIFEIKGTWEEANRKCESEEMSLAMPKDENSTEFIVNQLRPIFGYGVQKKFIGFWMGLRFNMSEQQWRWTDGSALEDYTGGRASFKMYTYMYNCAALHVVGMSDMWLNFECDETFNTFYPICEKRFFI